MTQNITLFTKLSRNRHNLLWMGFSYILFMLFFSSCSVTKYVPEDKYLLRKNKIVLESDKKGSEKEELKEQIETLTAQKTNTYLLGFMPYKVWLYNLRHKRYEQDSSNFQIRSKTVEVPVLLDTSMIGKSRENMGFHLSNNGYFHHQINTRIDTLGKKTTVVYQIKTGNRYLIKNINYEVSDSTIERILQTDSSEKFLQVKGFYSNTLAGEERNRIANLIKNHGYYNFSVEQIKFELDTLHATVINSDNLAGSIIDALFSRNTSTYELKVKIKIEDNKQKNAFVKYKIGNVVVYMNMTDTMRLNSLYQLANNEIINPELQVIYQGKPYLQSQILEQKILIKPGNYYTLQDYDQTIRQLTDLYLFQYIRIRYSAPTLVNGEPRVNAIILLAPSNRFGYGFNTEVSSGDIYVLGANVNTSITYNNLFKTANQLSLTGSGGIAFENINKKKLQLFSQTYGANAKFVVPGMLFFNSNPFGKSKYAQTEISTGLNFLDRTNFFFLRNINASIAYRSAWRQHSQISFKPLFINILKLSNISTQFQERMDSIPAIKNAYQPIFIEGEGLEWVYNKSTLQDKRRLYFKVGLEEAGLLLNGINQLTNIHPFAEYVRLDFDARKYYNTHFSSLIFRISGGIGIPYGQSITLPYIKQYYAGGPYSIRGWQQRLLGPGSYRDPNLNDPQNLLFVDQTGDIKLEMNAEYRFVIARLFANAISLNGAVFADAGNIWLAKKELSLPGAVFNINTLFQDLAISSGAGFRIDFGGFLVLRLDYAIQLKKPYIFEYYGWNTEQLKQMQLFNSDWRQENSYLSIAIGYPF